MKILALRLANLASLPGPLELDFSAAPLRDAGLFAITGPTAPARAPCSTPCAWRSTAAPRDCARRRSATPRCRRGGRDAHTADPRTPAATWHRQRLRRGRLPGPRRPPLPRPLGGAPRPREGRRPPAGRRAVAARPRRRPAADHPETRVRPPAPERLGLSFDQFTRAVLLAQSEFAASSRPTTTSAATCSSASRHRRIFRRSRSPPTAAPARRKRQWKPRRQTRRRPARRARRPHRTRARRRGHPASTH